jgi:hypothetical protein
VAETFSRKTNSIEKKRNITESTAILPSYLFGVYSYWGTCDLFGKEK